MIIVLASFLTGCLGGHSYSISRASGQTLEFLQMRYDKEFIFRSGGLVDYPMAGLGPRSYFYALRFSPHNNPSHEFVVNAHYENRARRELRFLDSYQVSLLYQDRHELEKITPNIRIWYWPNSSHVSTSVTIDIDAERHWPFHHLNLSNTNFTLADFYEPASVLLDVQNFIYSNAERFMLRGRTGPELVLVLGDRSIPMQGNGVLWAAILNIRVGWPDWQDYTHLLEGSREEFIKTVQSILYNIQKGRVPGWGAGFTTRFIQLR